MNSKQKLSWCVKFIGVCAIVAVTTYAVLSQAASSGMPAVVRLSDGQMALLAGAGCSECEKNFTTNKSCTGCVTNTSLAEGYNSYKCTANIYKGVKECDDGNILQNCDPVGASKWCSYNAEVWTDSNCSGGLKPADDTLRNIGCTLPSAVGDLCD